MPTVARLTEDFLSVLGQAVSAGRAKAATREWYYYQFLHLGRAKDPHGCLVADRDADSLIPEDLAGAPYTFHFCRAVRSLFHWAKRAGHVQEFRFHGFEGPPCGQRERILTEEEYTAIMRVAGHELRQVLWFMRHTLARPGEIRQVRWCEVDLEKGVFRLRNFKARDRRRDGVRMRKIPLPPPALRLLRYWYRTRKPAHADLVFVGRRKPWNKNSLRLAMARATKAAGVNLQPGEKVVCYTLRHTGATEATRRGTDQKLLADIMGHTTTRMTERYVHLTEEDLVRGIAIATKRTTRPSPSAIA